jgi:hypothetical protein
VLVRETLAEPARILREIRSADGDIPCDGDPPPILDLIRGRSVKKGAGKIKKEEFYLRSFGASLSSYA